ncbi:MAG: hypothetical protein ABIR32_02765 [Ilumatobacteraceae bacterium]
MSTTGTATATTATIDDSTTSVIPVPEQLTLLGTTEVPFQFRIDERTRRSGLAHIAALRAQLSEQAAQRNLTVEGRRPLARPINRQIAA